MFKERVKPTTTLKVFAPSVPGVLISQDALIKMNHYVQECSDEIGWLGTAYRDGHGIYIEDVFLFDQEVHATTTEITPQGLETFANELLQNENGMEIWNNMKMWGHSHVNMGVSPSAQDDSQMTFFQNSGYDWFIRLIANKKGELKIDLYDYQMGIVYIDLPWFQETSAEEADLRDQINELEAQLEAIRSTMAVQYQEEVKSEMSVKVRKKVYASSTTYHNTTRGTNGATTRTNTSNSTEDPSGSTNKKNTHGLTVVKNETENERPLSKNEEKSAESREKLLNTYQSDDEVVQEFSAAELIVLGLCKGFSELEQELAEMGYYNWNFTEADLERIFRVAMKYSARMTGGM